MTLKNVLLLVTPSSSGRLAGVARFARSHGWHLTVADRLTHALSGWTGDGALVTLRDDVATLKYVRSLIRRRIPVVDLTITRPEIRLPRVIADNPAIGRAAAGHFTANFFRNTAWFSTTWGVPHELRCNAFSDALPAPCRRWIWSLETSRSRSDDWNALSRWLRRCMDEAPKPLGVFCFDDVDASRVEFAALSAGLSIPDEIAILGTGNDVPLCDSQPIAISSVRHNLERNGFVGAALLERLMSGGRPPESLILIPPVGIAARRSTESLAASHPLVRRAMGIYAAELAKPPSTEQLAERLAISRATLDRAFAADFGQSPAKMLARLRIDEAKRQLRSGGLTAYEIATRLGFCDSAYFANVFRRVTGLSPKDWRRQHGDATPRT